MLNWLGGAKRVEKIKIDNGIYTGYLKKGQRCGHGTEIIKGSSLPLTLLSLIIRTNANCLAAKRAKFD